MRNALLLVTALVAALLVWALIGLRRASTPVERTAAVVEEAPRAALERDGELARDAPGSTRASALDDRPEERTSAPATAAVEETARVRGRLVDPAGAPVTGALVTLRGRGASWADPDALATQGEDGRWRGVAVESDADGAFELAVPVPKGDVELVAVPAGDHDRLRIAFRADDERPGPLAEGLTDLGTLMLVVTGSIEGGVADEAGDPVTTAHVSIVVEGGGRSTDVDANGRYVLRNVPPGRYEVRATCAGRMRGIRKDVEVVARRTTTGIDFLLGPSPTIEGRVVDTLGAPERVRVLATPLSGSGSSTVSAATDPDGRFTLELASDDVHRLRVRRTDGLQLARPPAPVIAAAGERDVAIVVEHVPVTVLVVLDDTTGAPVTAFDVLLARKKGGVGHEQDVSTERRPDGSAAVEVDGEVHTLVVRAAGYVPWGGPVAHEDGDGTQTVRLERGASIRGRVVAGDRPVRSPAIWIRSTRMAGGDGKVWILSEPDEAGNPVPPPDDPNPDPVLPQHQGRERLVHGATDGTFRIDGLAAGRYRLGVVGPDGRRLAVPRVDIAARADVDLGDLALPAGGRIVGTVLVPPGMDPSSLGIGFTDAADAATHADAAGRFALEGVTAGRYEIHAVRDRIRFGRPQHVRVEDGGTTEVAFDLTASLPCRVHVHVLVRGAPHARMRARGFDVDGRPADGGRYAVTDDAGRVMLEVEPGKPIEVLVFAPSSLFLGRSAPLDCPPGGERSVELDLALGALTVELPDGHALPTVGRGVLEIAVDGERTLARELQERSTIRFDCGPTEARPLLSDVVLAGRAWDLGAARPGRTTVRLTLAEDGFARPDSPKSVYEGTVDVSTGERAVCTLVRVDG